MKRLAEKVWEFVKINKIIIFFVIVGAVLRLYKLGEIPVPLNQDEAGAGYEALSILQTGGDKWGYKFPGYFLSWGTGQNVLYSYLSIPFLITFGYSTFSLRLLQALLGILTIGLLYLTCKRLQNKTSALIITGVLTFSPWHIMMSRWALESNLLPFFVLLSTFCFSYAFEPITKILVKKWLLGLGFLALGLACYAYATFWFVLPFYLILLGLFFRKSVIKNWPTWLVSFGILVITTIPLILFVIKNNLLHRELGFEQYLPFGLPLLAGDRVKINPGDLYNNYLNNIGLLTKNGYDGLAWNSFSVFSPVLFGIIFLLPIAVFWSLHKKDINLFLLQIFSVIPSLLLLDLNLNRANVLWIPIIVIVTSFVINYGSEFLSPKKAWLRETVKLVTFIIVASYSLIFCGHYFLSYNNITNQDFYGGYDKAIVFASQNIPSQQAVLTDQVSIGYVVTALDLKLPAKEFQQNTVWEKKDGEIKVYKLNQFYFDKDYLKSELSKQDKQMPDYWFVTRKQVYPCQIFTITYQIEGWDIGKCSNKNQQLPTQIKEPAILPQP